VLTLSPDMLLAYDTEQGGLQKAWKGQMLYLPRDSGVAVPAAQSNGFPYLEADSGQTDWIVWYQGQRLEPQPVFRRLEVDGLLSKIHFALPLPSGDTIEIAEYPEHLLAKKPKEGRHTLLRTFWLKQVPKGAEVRLAVTVDNLWKGKDLKASGKWENDQKLKRHFDWGTLYDFTGELLLKPGDATTLKVTFTMSPEEKVSGN
jgi:hypothetical protein